jgi:hypothetical protein
MRLPRFNVLQKARRPAQCWVWALMCSLLVSVWLAGVHAHLHLNLHATLQVKTGAVTDFATRASTDRVIVSDPTSPDSALDVFGHAPDSLDCQEWLQLAQGGPTLGLLQALLLAETPQTVPRWHPAGGHRSPMYRQFARGPPFES